MELTLLASPALMVFAHMILVRGLRRRPPQAVALYAIAVASAPTALTLYLTAWLNILPGEHAWFLIYCTVVYLGFGMFYFHFFNTSETARRIKLLYEIYREGSLSEQRITELYSTQDVVRLRLLRLVETDQLGFEGGHYFMKGRLLYAAAKAVAFWRHILGIAYCDSSSNSTTPEKPAR